MPEEEGTKPAEPTGPVPEKPSEPQEAELPAEPAEDGEEILYYRSTGKTPPAKEGNCHGISGTLGTDQST